LAASYLALVIGRMRGGRFMASVARSFLTDDYTPADNLMAPVFLERGL
jgi:hypothetical protein